MSAVLKEAQGRWDLVAPSEIEALWPSVVTGISEALGTSNGEATAEDTKAGLIAGRTRLLLMNQNGGFVGAVLQILSFPRYKNARVFLAFGHGMDDVREVMASAEAWLKKEGCKFIEAWVSTESRARLFARHGYKKTYTIVRKPL